MILAYCHATLQDDTLDSITPYLQQRGIGIVAASALSMGLLSNRVSLHFPCSLLLEPFFPTRTRLLALRSIGSFRSTSS